MSGRERTATPPQGQSAPLDRGTRARAENRLGTDLSGVRVARGVAADHATRAYNARALTTGNLVVLGSDAGAQDLGHELVHVAQRARFGTGPAVQSRTSDPAEAEARRLGPQVLSQGGPLAITAQPSARVNRNGGDDDAEPTAQERGWSFDPYATDVATMGNENLVTTTLMHRVWLSNHTILELDWEAHKIELDRLDIEREWRIELGHLWLADIDQGVTNVVQLVPGANGAIDVVAPPLDLVSGSAADISDRPIMSAAQFETMQAEQGYQKVQLADYLDQVTQFNTSVEETAPDQFQSQTFIGPTDTVQAEEMAELDAAYRRLFGVQLLTSRLSPRDTRLPDAFGNQSSQKRVGNLSEVTYGTSAENFFGLRGLLQDETVKQNHPRTDYRRYFSDIDTSVKSRDPTAPKRYNSANPIERYGNYLEGQQTLLNTHVNKNPFEKFMEVSGRGRTEAQVRAQSQLAINADDFAAYHALVGNPFALPHETARKPTSQQDPVTRVYDGLLQDVPVQTGDGGAPITTVKGLDKALAEGRIGVVQHRAAIDSLARAAQSQLVPNPDFTAKQAEAFQSAFDDMDSSLKVEEAPPKIPKRHRGQRDPTSKAAQNPVRVDQFKENYLKRHSTMFAETGSLLHVAPADVRPYQELLRSPFARDATKSGVSPKQNYTREPVKQVYDGVLQTVNVKDTAGNVYKSMDEINTAKKNGTLTAREHYKLVDRIGRMAARTVAPDLPGAHEEYRNERRANKAQSAEIEARRKRANNYIKRNASPEYMSALSKGGGAYGKWSTVGTYGGRAGLLGAFMGAGQEWRHSESGFDDPELIGRMAWAAGRYGTRGGLAA